MPEQKTLRCDKTIIVKRARKNVILIVGDSHVKGKAIEIQHNLEKDYVRFEVFTAVTMKKAVFWDVAPCRSGFFRRNVSPLSSG
jgi:hypothetical protein